MDDYKKMSGFDKMTDEELAIQLEKDLRSLNAMREHAIYIEKYGEKYYDCQNEISQSEIGMIFDAINMRIQAFSELSVQISNPFQWSHDVIPWGGLRKLRNAVSHEYELINYDIVELVIESIVEFRTAIEQVLDEYEYL